MILTLGTTPAVQRSMTFARLEIDAVNRTADVLQYASGKSINAARVLHALGEPVTCTGFVGGDTGEFLLSDLDDAEIEHRFVRVEPSTRLCITLVDQTAGTATELIEEARAISAHCFDQLLAKFHQALPALSGVMLCGSLPKNAPVDFYANCVSAAQSAGKFVLLDAVGEPLTRALAFGPTIVKPNRHELSQTVNALVETDEQLKAAVVQLVERGTRWAVITDGSRETVASDGKTFWKISTPRVKVVSPIGSGDAFAAGLAAGVLRGQEVPEACRLACACGAANAMSSRAGDVNPADLPDLIRQVQITTF
jgi:tagatose 6-phosphate kinase